MFVKPWDEKSRKILEQLTRDGKTYTTDIEITRAFGRYFPELEDNEFLDIARVDRKKKTWFVAYPNVRVRSYKNKKFEFYKF
jgi:hypothetical protein